MYTAQAEGIIGTVMDSVKNSNLVTKDLLESKLTDVRMDIAKRETKLIDRINAFETKHYANLHVLAHRLALFSSEKLVLLNQGNFCKQFILRLLTA